MFKVLNFTRSIAEKARLSSVSDFGSAVEISLAIKANIGAIVTHKPEKFSDDKLTIITLTDVQQRQCLEDNLLKNTYTTDLPAVLVIESELISNLNKALYHLPSYITSTPLKPKKLPRQLSIEHSQDKVSAPLADKSSSKGWFYRSIGDIFIDAVLSSGHNTPEIARRSSIDDWHESLQRSIQASSSLIDKLYPQHKLHLSIDKIDALKVELPSLPANIFPPESTFARSINPELLANKNHHDDLIKNIVEAERSTRLSSFSSGLLSSKSALARAIGQIDARPVGLLVADNHLKTLKEDFDRLNKLGYSFINNISSQSLSIQSIDWIQTARIGQSFVEAARPLQLSALAISSLQKTARIGQSITEAARPIQLSAFAIDSLSTQSIVAGASGTIGSLDVAHLANNPFDNLMKNVVEVTQSSQLSATAICRASSQLLAAHPIESIYRLKPAWYQSQLARSNGQVNILASACQSDKIRLGDSLITRSISQAGLVESSLAERANVTRSGRIGDGKAHAGLIAESSSYDPSRLFAQTKLLESMSRIGLLDTALSRKR